MVVRPRTSLALCAGYGGLERAVARACPGIRLVGAVERQAYAGAVLADRMVEGSLAPCPVWDDLESFDCGPYRGRVDLVAAGFPCQGASVAGRRLGIDDERWLWPLVLRTVVAVDASWLFFENVPGLLSVNGGTAFEGILGDLASLGWAAEWDCVPAAAVGAPHLRDRLFLLAANANRIELRQLAERIELGPAERGHAESRRARRARRPGPADAPGVGCGEGSTLEPGSDWERGPDAARSDRSGPGSAADPGGARSQRDRSIGPTADRDRAPAIARADSDPNRAGRAGRRSRRQLDRGKRPARGGDADRRGGPEGGHADTLGDVSERARRRVAEIAESGRAHWEWGRAPEPEIRGMDDGTSAGLGDDPSRPDQIHLLGNGVVEQAAAAAFAILWDRLHGTDLDVLDGEG